MSSWSPWSWDGSQQVYYRARKGPQDKWQYEFTKPMSTTTVRETGPQYATIPNSNAVPVKAPSYLIQPHIIAGGSLVALCADLTIFEPEPREMVKNARKTYVRSLPPQQRNEWMGSGLVMEKGTPGARKERRTQRREGVTRVHDWRTRLDEW